MQAQSYLKQGSTLYVGAVTAVVKDDPKLPNRMTGIRASI